MTPLTIVVSGMIAAVPGQGGAAWAVLQYLLGFKRLGHEVVFIESLRRADLTPPGTPLAASSNAEYFRHVMDAFAFGGSALLLEGTRETVGLPYAELCQLADRAEVLINLSGLLTDTEISERISLRVYVDLDPAFTQLWNSVQRIDMGFSAHTHFVTIGRAIGRADCPVPSCGRDWITTFQPLVLSEWPVTETIEHAGLTTIANWRGYGSVDHDGVFYGQKAHSLRPLLGLPSMTGERFMLAIAIHPDERADLQALRENGWQLLEPSRVADTPQRCRRFIQGSKGEFGIAKSGYVAARCGWFSDRSICYLACGRPVIAQDTGFDQFLPTGEGLFSFDDAAGVLSAIEALNADYPAHRRAARAIAEAHFDSSKVLGRLLRLIGAAP